MTSKNEANVKIPIPRRLFSMDSLTNNKNTQKRKFVPQREGTLPEKYGTVEERTESNSIPVQEGAVPASRHRDARKALSPLTTSSTRSSSPDPSPTSPSQARWEQLRQHVFLAPSHGSRSESPSLPLQPPPSVPSSVTSFPRPPSRSTTPKPSRLVAKLGFRHVVDHAREAAIDENRKLSEDILKACLATHRIESQSKPKHERENTLAAGSSKHLPFISNVSLNTTVTGATNPSAKRPEQRHSVFYTFATPSVKHLYQLLWQASSSSGASFRSAHLPHESHVLSALLVPFFTTETSDELEEERWLAVDAFELLVKSWLPENELSSAERCIWCTKAALLPPSPLRSRILSDLWGLTRPDQNNHVYLSPDAIQSVACGIFTLLPLVSSGPESQADGTILKESMTHLCSGPVDQDAFENSYDAEWSKEDSQDEIRRSIVSESLSQCLGMCSRDTRIWLWQQALEEYWYQVYNMSLLQMSLCSRRFVHFSNAAVSLISDESISLDIRIILVNRAIQFLERLIIPQVSQISGSKGEETESAVARVVLEVLSFEGHATSRWATSVSARWYSDEQERWRVAFEETLKMIITTSEWHIILRILTHLLNKTPDNVRKSMVAFIYPHLTERLVQDPPNYPNLKLSEVLRTISRLYPPIFFKPLFSCAASTKELVVSYHLCILAILSKFVPDFWIRDAEMMSVALMSDVGGNISHPRENEDRSWANARLGQTVILLELTDNVRRARRHKDSATVDGPSSVQLLKFISALEVRLGVLIEAKEKTSLLPLLQRLLLCILFREFRLLTRSLKPAKWLASVVTWLEEYFRDQDLEDQYEQQLQHHVSELQNLYLLARGNASSSHKRHTFAMMPLNASSPIENASIGQIQIADLVEKSLNFIDSVGKGFPLRVFKLLVVMSSLLTPNDLLHIGPIIWNQELWSNCTSVVPSICFLIMQCAEKAALNFRGMVEVDLRSSDEQTRIEAVQKISTVVNWRFQIMSQEVLVDRTHRPFKLARAPLPFVPTDMGSVNYVYYDHDDDKSKGKIPNELKKQLAEIGWVDDDKPVDHKEEWLRTPVSLMATNQVERLELYRDRSDYQLSFPLPLSSSKAYSNQMALSPGLAHKSEEGELLRRNSSTTGPTHAKRRAIFVPPLSLIFRVLANLVHDASFTVATATRSALVDIMRNDPSLLLRPILDLFSGEGKDFLMATNILTAILHTRHLLPPSTAHAMFNNLSGYLKFAVRQTDASESLQEFALIIPILAELVNQIGDLTIREIRRSKMEHFLLPYGTFWFSHPTPDGVMFPRSLGPNANPFETTNPRLVSIVLIRISQNFLFIEMLKKNSQDVQVVRRIFPRLVLPSLTEGEPRVLELKDFIPFRNTRRMNEEHPASATLKILSLALARSYVILVAQIFKCMSRNSNDREEMAKFIDGLNQILLTHGDDISIVGHILVAFMVASARFKRLFTSSGGYALLIPALAKVYVESSEHVGIKLAIEYTICRFYALHRESFLFQSLDAIASVTALPDTDSEHYAILVYEMFYSLRHGISPTDLDPAGIHDINRSQEKEALLFSAAEDTPQTFLTAIRRGEAQTNGQIFFDIPNAQETSRLRMEDLVKLFLTIIAHDPAILRAQHFLHLFKYFVPQLYHASGHTRSTLLEGLTALANILSKPFIKSKGMDTSAVGRTHDSEIPFANDGSDMQEKSKIASNPNHMRVDFLFALLAAVKTGAQIPLSTIRRTIEIAKTVLRESPIEMIGPLSTFFADFSKFIILGGELLKPKFVIAYLKELSPVIRSFVTTLDFSPVLETIAQASRMQSYSNEPAFAQLVVNEICAIGLEACALPAGNGNLPKLQVALVQLLTEAVFFNSTDLISVLEKQRPTFILLSKIILPLVSVLSTTEQLTPENQQSEAWHRTALISSWIRLLFYTMTACQRSFPSTDVRSLSRSKSRDKRNKEAHLQSHLPTFLATLQILKVIVIRAELEISSTLPDIWHRLASFLRFALVDGNASFALQGHGSNNLSPSPSPSPSPRTSINPTGPRLSFGDLVEQPFRGSSPFIPPARPRVIDYALWSILEFLCAYRSPLRLQLRMFTIEKVVALDQELRNTQQRASPFASPNTAATSPSRRISTSIFAKPRRYGMFISPESSPRISRSPYSYNESIPSIHLGPSKGFDNSSPSLLEIPQSNSPNSGSLRIPGYQYVSPTISSPSTPKQSGGIYGRTEHQDRGPRIIHLGPTSPSAFNPPPLSPTGGGSMGVSNIRLMAESTKIKSLSLVKATYRKIRNVQTFMGYDTLLPVPGAGTAGLGIKIGAETEGTRELEEISVAIWTKRTALKAVMTEMKLLEEEFEDLLRAAYTGEPTEEEQVEGIIAENVPIISVDTPPL